MSSRAGPDFLISGATGAVGSEFLRQALVTWPKARMICLVRSEGAAEKLLRKVGPNSDRLHIVFADITDEASMRMAAGRIGGLGAVMGVHAAADVSWDKTAEQMWPLNVEGTYRFCDIMRTVAKQPRLVYLSTAYTSTQSWEYRNGYEKTKAEAERFLCSKAQEFRVKIFASSLVVGNSNTGELGRHNGIYPMLRFLAEFSPPFIVGRKQAELDIVPVDWVIAELIALIDRHMTSESAVDVVAAAGAERRLTFERTVRIAEERINLFRRSHGLEPTAEVPILRSRQWAFLRRSLSAWKPPDLNVGDFRYFERLLQIYGTYSENDLVRTPSEITKPAPHPETFMPVVIDRWLDDHADWLMRRVSRRELLEEMSDAHNSV